MPKTPVRRVKETPTQAARRNPELRRALVDNTKMGIFRRAQGLASEKRMGFNSATMGVRFRNTQTAKQVGVTRTKRKKTKR